MNKMMTWENSSASLDILRKLLSEIDLNYPTIVMLEPYGSSVALLKKARERHFNCIVLTANNGLRRLNAKAMELAQVVIQIDTLNDAMVSQLMFELIDCVAIQAIIPGFEYFVTLAAHLAEMLKLPGIPTHCVKSARCKDKMRVYLQDAGIKTPRFKLIHAASELTNLKYHMSFPMVCKPVDAAGSVLVKKVVNENELIEACQSILNHENILWGYKLSQTCLVEEYIEGKEYSVEGIVQNDQVYIYSVTEKTVADQCEFIEIAHQVHAPLPKNMLARIHAYCHEVVWSLGLNNTPFHAELRIDCHQDPVLMEIAARLAGDNISELISLSSSVNYLEQVLSVYLGEPVIPPGDITGYAGIRFFYRPSVDWFSHIKSNYSKETYHDSIQDIQYYYQGNTDIPSFPKPLRRLGHVIMVGKDYSQIKKGLYAIDQATCFLT